MNKYSAVNEKDNNCEEHFEEHFKIGKLNIPPPKKITTKDILGGLKSAKTVITGTADIAGSTVTSLASTAGSTVGGVAKTMASTAGNVLGSAFGAFGQATGLGDIGSFFKYGLIIMVIFGVLYFAMSMIGGSKNSGDSD